MVVGIDAGGRKLAVVILDGDNVSMHDYQVKPIAYQTFYRGAVKWLESLKPQLEGHQIYMEAPVLAGVRNIQSTIRVAQTTGIVHAVLEHVSEVAVSSWKKGTQGNGNASKTQVQGWLDETHAGIARLCRGNQDLYDAACIALHGQQLG